jgi:NAD(P)-dependent dehydrogenase (short-subunit alcohol dehydrogenase family)
VTGGDLGIGFEVSKALALSRARVLMLSRKEEHGEEAIAKIKEVCVPSGVEERSLTSHCRKTRPRTSSSSRSTSATSRT